MSNDQKLSVILSEFARTMLMEFRIEEILDSLVDRIVDILPIDAAGVSLIDANLQPDHIAASDPLALRCEKLQTALAEGPCIEAYKTGESVFVEDLHSDERFSRFREEAIAAGLRSVFTFPLWHGEERLGALDLYKVGEGTLDPSDTAVAQTLADVTAAYIVNAQARADLVHASDHAHSMAVHDALTGLPNRVLLLERMEHALLRAQRTMGQTALFFIDIDGFKGINDRYGHATGDALLVAIGLRLSALIRPGDTLARLSGDEFVILCEDLKTEAEAHDIATRVGRSLAFPFALKTVHIETSASIGVAFAKGTATCEQILREADLAMYQVKRAGGDHHSVLDFADQVVRDRRSGLRDDLRTALNDEQLRVEYQPIVRADDGRVAGVEALLRWTHPTFGPLSPTVVIPIAEESALIDQLGLWVLKQACADHMRWAEAVPPALNLDGPPDMCVNVSARQLMGVNFVAKVESALDGASMPPSSLTIEVTESVLIRDPRRALRTLKELKKLGANIALDDFGTGFSSLSYLRTFPVDTVKIDRSFIADLVTDDRSRVVVAAIIPLAHNLGMTIVAEGIETDAQYVAVRNLGADLCQGFLFWRPMPAADLVSVVSGPLP